MTDRSIKTNENGQILVLDIGTTTAKSTVFDMTGKTLSFAAIPYTFLKRPAGWFEQDPEEVYQAVLHSAGRAVEEARKEAPNAEVEVVSIVCQGGSLIPCDRDGAHIYPMLTWMDQRAVEEAKELSANTGKYPITAELLKEKTGRDPDPGMPLCMILWMKEHDPETYNKARRWMCLNDYVIHRLTGNYITEPSSAVFTQMFSIREDNWDSEIAEMAGVDPQYLSEIRPCKSICGTLLGAPANEMGIREVPVVNSMHDRTGEAVGLGAFHTGDSWIGTGTAWVPCSILDRSEVQNIRPNYHVIPEYWIASRLVGGLGSSVEYWVPQLMARRGISERGAALQAMTELATEAKPGCNGLFYKAFTGTENEGSFVGETESHTDADRCRAVYESIVFDFLEEYEIFTEQIPACKKAVLVGGAARSSYWPQIIAEILGMELNVSKYEHDATLGGAILAKACLEEQQLPETVRDPKEEMARLERIHNEFKRPSRIVLPEPANVKAYKAIYETRKSLW